MPLLTEHGTRVTVNFTLDELAELAIQTTDRRVSERLLCAIGLIDQEKEIATRVEVAEARG